LDGSFSGYDRVDEPYGIHFSDYGDDARDQAGIISLMVLTLAIVTRYFLHLAWRKTYVIAACTARYRPQKFKGSRRIIFTKRSFLYSSPMPVFQFGVLALEVCERDVPACVWLDI
jgi:hypothetical protein